MNNHNTHFYSKEEVERTLKSTEEFEDGEQLFYFIGTLRFLYDENKEKDKEIERLKAREEEITQKYLSATKYASEIEEKYVVDEYIIDELEKIIDSYELGKYDYEIPVAILKNKLKELKGDK